MRRILFKIFKSMLVYTFCLIIVYVLFGLFPKLRLKLIYMTIAQKKIPLLSTSLVHQRTAYHDFDPSHQIQLQV